MFGIGDLAGGLVGGALSYKGAREANKMNQKMAREQMQFQERMSNTSYQRAVADMQSAGINPMLAVMQGGASSPGGATANMQNEIAPAVSSAMDSMRTRAEVKNLREQNKNIQSQTLLNRSLAGQAEATAGKTNSQNILFWIDHALKGASHVGGVVNAKLKMLKNFFNKKG